jgi:hypothetical protein
MNVTLTLITSGFAVGFASGGLIWLYMLLSRPYRKIRNRIVIHVGQAFVGISGIGGLLVVQELEQRFSIERRSSSHYALLYAYVFGLLCVVVFTLRAEFRWRRSVRRAKQWYERCGFCQRTAPTTQCYSNHDRR